MDTTHSSAGTENPHPETSTRQEPSTHPHPAARFTDMMPASSFTSKHMAMLRWGWKQGLGPLPLHPQGHGWGLPWHLHKESQKSCFHQAPRAQGAQTYTLIRRSSTFWVPAPANGCRSLSCSFSAHLLFCGGEEVNCNGLGYST